MIVGLVWLPSIFLEGQYEDFKKIFGSHFIIYRVGRVIRVELSERLVGLSEVGLS